MHCSSGNIIPTMLVVTAHCVDHHFGYHHCASQHHHCAPITERFVYLGLPLDMYISYPTIGTPLSYPTIRSWFAGCLVYRPFTIQNKGLVSAQLFWPGKQTVSRRSTSHVMLVHNTWVVLFVCEVQNSFAFIDLSETWLWLYVTFKTHLFASLDMPISKDVWKRLCVYLLLNLPERRLRNLILAKNLLDKRNHYHYHCHAPSHHHAPSLLLSIINPLTQSPSIPLIPTAPSLVSPPTTVTPLW